MKTKNIFILIAGLLSCTFSGCDDKIDPVITELELDRALTPGGLEAVIRNGTTIEVSWNTRDDADHYVVEFSEDSLEFTNIVRTVTVQPEEIPIQETFFGDTRYSVRVKAVSADGAEDSKWVAGTLRTDPENI